MPYPTPNYTISADVSLAAGATDVVINVVASAGALVNDYLATPGGNLLVIDLVPDATSIRVDHLVGPATILYAGTVLTTPPPLQATRTTEFDSRPLSLYANVLLVPITPGATAATIFSQPIPVFGANAVWIYTIAASNPGAGSRINLKTWVPGHSTPKTWNGSAGSLLVDLAVREVVGTQNWAYEGGYTVHAILPSDISGASGVYGATVRRFVGEVLEVSAYTTNAVAVNRVDVFVQY